jgi:hypothetical protein
VWIIAPVLVAPLISLKVPGFPGAGIEQNAPQALIYGWALQFGYAVIPYLFRRFLLPEQPAKLGGSWFSLLTAHLGGVFLWVSIFALDYQAVLHGLAYALWVASLIPVLLDLWRVARAAWAHWERQSAAPPGGEHGRLSTEVGSESEGVRPSGLPLSRPRRSATGHECWK